MRVYEGIVDLKDTCVAWGVFDGMHRGHRKVVEELTAQAKKNGLVSVIVSCPGEGAVLTTEKEKEYLLKDSGVDIFITASPEEDMVTAMTERLGAKRLIVGENYENINVLKEEAEKAGIQVVLCETVMENGEPITTESVKKALQACDFEKVTALCGHQYIMLGEVVHGKALGRTVGMPTANLGVPDCKLKPPSGVYATSVKIDEEVFKAMTNIGKRPSVDEFDYVTIEAFILDFARDIYGKRIELEVYKYVRGVQKFDCLADVQKQVEIDIETVRNVLNI